MRAVCSLLAVLLAGVAIVSGGGARADEPPAGKQAFERVCKVCHGPDGQGDAGPALVPMDREYEDVIAIVRDGTGQMPPIAPERVSDDEVKAIVAYLKSVKPPDNR